MFDKIIKIFTNGNNNTRSSVVDAEEPKVFQTENPIYFMDEESAFLGKNFYPRYSYKDFNDNANVFSDLLKPETEDRYYLEFENNITGLNKVLCEAKLRFNKLADEKAYFQFGTIDNQVYRQNGKHFGAMTYLVGSLIYIILNDKEFQALDVEFSLDMQMEAKKVYLEGTDVYYHVFNSEKHISNPSLEGLHREKTFFSENRLNDLEYFRKLLSEKEEMLLSINSSVMWKNI